ncbi:kinase-like domain-containing protein [Pilobolus umbonatus]|nr:kinase-like domain-containing protein [Pilobolus umbonatus]
MGPLYRLYHSDHHRLNDIRDNINAILILFTDITMKESTHYPHLSIIQAKAAVVHCLGDYHPIENEKNGWMKVKIIQISPIRTHIPTYLSDRLFHTLGNVQRLDLRPIVNDYSSENNKLISKFIFSFIKLSTRDMRTLSSPNNPYSYTQNSYYSSAELITSVLNPNISTSALLISAPEDYMNTHVMHPAHRLPHPSNQKEDHARSLDTHLTHWEKLDKYCKSTKVDIIPYDTYANRRKAKTDAEGYFKKVYFLDEYKVVQLFQRSTSTQRLAEVVSLIKLKNKTYIGQIDELLRDESTLEVKGLTMERYDMTLKEYLDKFKHSRLSVYQKFDIILQMMNSVNAAHKSGIAHRDLSTVNFMVNVPMDRYLHDGSQGVLLFLIDFGKAVFVDPQDCLYWWVNDEEDKPHRDEDIVYEDEVKPRSKEDLIVWCKNLPRSMAKPDHGYRFYRSAETLPRNRSDHELLNHLIDPVAEDIYSLGAIIWKIFSGKEPWPGIFDTEFRKLRETVSSDFSIQRLLDREMPGPISKKFLSKFLRANPDSRRSIDDILSWIAFPEVQDELLKEWEVYGVSGRVKTAKADYQKKTKRRKVSKTTANYLLCLSEEGEDDVLDYPLDHENNGTAGEQDNRQFKDKGGYGQSSEQPGSMRYNEVIGKMGRNGSNSQVVTLDTDDLSTESHNENDSEHDYKFNSIRRSKRSKVKKVKCRNGCCDDMS